MKKIISFSVLIILPLLFSLFIHRYKDAYGEYFIGRNYDPSYPYLINSLNLAQMKGYGVGLITHPGTPVQELGALVIITAHSFRSGDITEDVISDPEYYLYRIFQVFLILNFLAACILGFIAFKYTGSLTSSIFLQFTLFTFLSEDIIFQLTNVSVEPILVFTILLMLSVIISYTNKTGNGKNLILYSVVFGLLCGLGMSTKITFLPVMIIPFLLLKQVKFKLLFIFISIFTFFIFIYPAISAENAGEFYSWVKNMILHSGKYGAGDENIVETSSYLGNVKSIFIYNIFFSVSYILLLIIFFLQFFDKYKNNIRANKYFILLVGILAAMTIQILMVAKHFSLYYMIPTYMFSVMGLLIANSVIISLYPDLFKSKAKTKTYYSVIFVLIIIFSVFEIKTYYKIGKYTRNGRNEARKIISSLEEDHKNSIVISSYECSNKEFALYLGCFYSGSQQDRYMKILKTNYPNSLYYNRWDNRFYEVWENNEIKSKLLNADKFYFQGFNEDITTKFMTKIKEMTNKPDATCKKIMTNYSGEALYEITLNNHSN